MIGSHLLYELVSEGKVVKALKRQSSNIDQVLKVFSYYSENPKGLFQQIEWIDGDVLDYFGLEEHLAGINEVYHCAAIVSFETKDRVQMIRNNVDGTANLVNASLVNQVKKFCHVSSVSALGPNQNGYPTDELTNWIPSRKVTAYSESKFFSETEVWRGIEEGLDAVIINPSIVIGPGNWNAGSPRIFKTVWDGLRFYSKGITGFVDVNDVVKAMTLLMEDDIFIQKKNQRFLLNSENWSYHQLFNLIADSLNKPRPSWKVTGLMLSIAWRAASFYNLMAATPLPVSRETAAAANSHTQYLGKKINQVPGFSYLPIKDSVQKTASFLLNDMQLLQ